MLSGVLLHVIEASLPVDLASNGVANRAIGERSGEHVRDALILVDDVGDSSATQRAQVGRLAA
jgi:hypothetical protein